MTNHYDDDTLLDYLHGALDPTTDAAVFAHLEACATCRRVHDREAVIGESLRGYYRDHELELPSMVKARVWDAVRHQPPSFLDRLRARWVPAMAVPVVAVLAVAAYLGTPIFHAGNAPGVSATYFLDEHDAEATQNPLGLGAAPAAYTIDSSSTTAASYIDSADAATLDDADGASR